LGDTQTAADPYADCPNEPVMQDVQLQQAAAPPAPQDVDALFPDKGGAQDVDSLFPASIEADRKSKAQGISHSPINDLIFGDKTVNPVARILDSFGQGFEQGWGTDQLGLSQESTDQLKKLGIFNDYQKSQASLVKTANEVLIRPAATALEVAWRATQGAFRGGQAVVQQAGEEVGAPQLGHEIAALPEAFPTGIHGPISPGPSLLESARAMRVIGAGERGWAGTGPVEVPKGEPVKVETSPQPIAGAPQEPQATATPRVTVPLTPENITPDIHTAARQAAPDVFARYDTLKQQQDGLQKWLTEREAEGQSEPGVKAYLDGVNKELDELSPQVKAAYQQAAETTNAATVPPPVSQSWGMFPPPEVTGTPAKIDATHTVLSGANSTADGTVVVDHNIPEFSPTLKDAQGNPANLHKYLAVHETAEADAMKRGMSYDDAHTKVATPAERAAVEADGVDWNAYTKEMDGYLDHIEHEPNTNPPSGQMHIDPEDAIGHHKSENKPSVPPEQVIKPIEAQRDFIVNDVKRQLIAAGRPESEAQAAGQLVAARYEARAARLAGARGSAEELYKAEGAQIRGPGGAAAPAPTGTPAIAPTPAAEAIPESEITTTHIGPKAARGPRAVPQERWSLLQFIADRGGIKADDKNIGDVRTIFGKDQKWIPGFGPLIRKDGMTLDHARELAVEAGYVQDLGQSGVSAGEATSNLDTLLQAMDREERGTKVYRQGVEPQEARERIPDAAELEQHQAVQAELDSRIENYLKEVGIKPNEIEPSIAARMRELMDRQRLEPDIAHERAVMEADDHAVETENAPERAEYIPGWDVPDDTGAAQGAGEAVAKGEEAAPGTRSRTDREGDREKAWTEFYQRDRLTPWSVTNLDHGQRIGKTMMALSREDAMQQLRDELKSRGESPHVIDARPLGRGNLNAEREAEGQQQIPGTERISDAERAQRAADQPLKPTAEQKPMDEGLFGDTMNQRELFQRKAQTESPEFKHWFGDSKVTDEHGDPLIVYHGTASEFDAFGKEHIGKIFSDDKEGFYFTNNVSIADLSSANDYANQAAHVTGGRPSVMPVYVSLKNPLIFDDVERDGFDGRGAVGHLEEILNKEDVIREAKEGGHDGIIVIDRSMQLGPQKSPEKIIIAFEPSQIKSAIGNRGTFDPNNPKLLEQSARGGIVLNPNAVPGHDYIGMENVKPLMRLTAEANASTFFHESGHHWLAELVRDAAHEAAPADLKADAQTVMDWLGLKGPQDLALGADASRAAKIKATKAHEKFARGFEQYLREGIAPSQQLAGVFAKVKQWMMNIYQTIKGLGAPINDEIKGVFDRMLAEQPQRTVIAPEIAKRPDLQDIHESDAVLTEPHEAERAADRIGNEDARARAELPKDIADEHRGSAEKIGTSPSEPIPLGENRGRPDTIAPGGAGSAELGAEPQGGGHIVPQGAGLRTREGGAGTIEPLPIGPHVPLDALPAEKMDKVGNIRLENLNTPADVNNAIRDLYRANRDQLDAATRGVVSDQTVMDLADAMGTDPRVVANNMERLRQMSVEDGVPLAARIWLMRDMFTKLSAEVANLAKGDDVAAFASARQRFLMAFETLSGVTAEMGRGMRAFRNMKTQMASAIEMANILKDDPKTLFQLKQQMALARAAETPAQSAAEIQRASRTPWQRIRAGVISYVINNLISGPITHVMYSVGNDVLQLFKALPETAAASLAGRVLVATGKISEEDRIRMGEAGPRLYGMVYGARDGLSASYSALKTGVSIMKGDPSGIDLFSNEIAYRPQEIPGTVGYVLETPSRSVAAIHTMHYGMNYESEIAALGYRDAIKQGFDPGTDEFNSHVAEFRMNPPRDAMDIAHTVALEQVLMRRPPYGGLQSWIQNLTNKYLLAKLVAPFVQIGGNILRGGFIERTPLGLMDQTVRDNLLGRNGAYKQQEQYGRMMVGSTLAVSTIGLAAQGILTGGGPSDPKQREVMEMTGWKPYSIKVGGEYIPYRKYLSVYGPLVAGAADMYEVGHAMSEKGLAQGAVALSFGFAEVVADETWMRGITSLIDAARHWDRDGAKYMRNLSTEFIPFSIGMRQIASLADPTWRSVRSEMDALRAHIPGMSQSLFPVRDLWGQPMRGGSMMSWSPAVNDPATIALQKAEYYPARPERKIRGIELTDQQYDDFTRIAGRDAKMRINAMISNPGFDLIPKQIRQEQLKNAMEGGRDMARTVILMQYPDIMKQALDAKHAILQNSVVH
jgi:hypothetical protein